MDNTNDLLKTLEKHHWNANRDLLDAETELTVLQGKETTPNPGWAVQRMMTKWGEEPLKTNQQIDMDAAVLWKTREQFEKELYEEETLNRELIKQMKEQCKFRIQKVREQANFKIDALESALAIVKHKSMVERERAAMGLEEMNSTLFNIQSKKSQLGDTVNSIVAMLSSGLDFTTAMGQATIRKLIDLMKSTLDTQQTVISQQTQEIKGLNQ